MENSTRQTDKSQGPVATKTVVHTDSYPPPTTAQRCCELTQLPLHPSSWITFWQVNHDTANQEKYHTISYNMTKRKESLRKRKVIPTTHNQNKPHNHIEWSWNWLVSINHHLCIYTPIKRSQNKKEKIYIPLL